MKNIFAKGDQKIFEKIVTKDDIAAFDGVVVHEVYSSFCLARDAEWCSRLFVLDIIEEYEEGIGTAISVEHVGPAFVGEKVTFTSTIEKITESGIVDTSYIATVNDRIIAKGIQGQRVLPKDKIAKLFYNNK
jgi:fluoroacetyl-CoA thioesterase